MPFSCQQFYISFALSILTTTLSQDLVHHTIMTRLTHFQSVDSPYFDSKKSMNDLAEFDMKSSIIRALHLTGNSSSVLHMTDIESELTPIGSGFFAHLQVGSNNVEQLVYMDTGSSLLWVNCEPCGLYVPGPIFHPMESFTYQLEDCSQSDICQATGAAYIQCDYDDDNDFDEYVNNRCTFLIRYGGGYEITGDLAREQFKFGDSAELLKDIVFGCSHKSELYANGVLGLGGSRLSLVSQTRYSKFSYCLGNISDRSYSYNKLVIGDRLKLRGAQTPLIVEDKYYINVEDIRIGNLSLEVNPEIFRRTSDYTGGMVVDIGSTYTFLPGMVLKKFESLVISDIKDELIRNYSISYRGYTRLCYNGVISRDLTLFPIVLFQFEAGAVMKLNVENIFQQVSEQTFCLAIVSSDILETTISILGSFMQQYFYVVYDLDEKIISFERMDCSYLEDNIHDEL